MQIILQYFVKNFTKSITYSVCAIILTSNNFNCIILLEQKEQKMNFWILVCFALLAFTLLTIVRKWHDYALLFTIAIGYAVNANIYNSISAPVYLGNIIFSVDSILYTGFMFAIIICAKEYGTKKAKILTSSSIAAILVSAFIEFFAKLSAFGYSTEILTSFLGYFYSAIGTFAGVWIMLLVFEKLENKKINSYLNFLICVLIASLINSTIYYALVTITTGTIDNFGYILLGSYIGKIFAIILGQISYYINTHYWIPNDLKDKYPSFAERRKAKNNKTDFKSINNDSNENDINKT